VRRAYTASTRFMSAIIMLLGVTMVVSALARGGGALALGVVLGTMLALLGAGRLWLARGGERGAEGVERAAAPARPSGTARRG
jgi:multisubunit Na+/H+ antiporter MnhB subunit